MQSRYTRTESTYIILYRLYDCSWHSACFFIGLTIAANECALYKEAFCVWCLSDPPGQPVHDNRHVRFFVCDAHETEEHQELNFESIDPMASGLKFQTALCSRVPPASSMHCCTGYLCIETDTYHVVVDQVAYYKRHLQCTSHLEKGCSNMHAIWSEVPPCFQIERPRQHCPRQPACGRPACEL